MANNSNSGFAALAVPEFRLLFFGLIFAQALMPLQFVSQIFWIQDSAGDANRILLIGAIGTTRGLGALTFGLIGGAFADRFDRRRLLIATQSSAFVLNACVAVVMLVSDGGPFALALFFTLTFGAASMFAVDMPTRQALIPDLVGRQLAPGAISLSQAGAQVAAPVSIFVSGIFVDAFGFGQTYAISCLGHAAAVVALLLMRYRPTLATGAPGARYGVRETYRDVRAGLAYTRSESTLLWVIVLLTTIMVMGFPAVANLGPTWVTTVVGVSFRNFGFVAIFWGGSAFVTSLLLTRFSNVARKGAILAVAAMVFAGGFCIFSSGTLAGAIIGNAALGCGMAAAQITATSLVQHIAPNEVRGRVMSILWLNMGLAQLVTLPVAAIAQVSSLRVLFPVMATALTVVVILIVLTRPQVRRARVEVTPVRPLEPAG
jgi:MFS family permease